MNMKRIPIFTRWLSLALLVCFPIWPAAAKQRAEIAITIDDLPSHGDLPSGMTRLDVAKSMIATFKAKGVPEVYGFVNAKRIEGDQGKADVLKIWVDFGFPLGNHSFSHLDLSTSSAQEFEEDIATNEAPLRILMGTADWHWFRYPFLHEGDTLEKRHAVKKYLQEHGYKVAQVTVDFEDYAWNNPYARCAEKSDTQAIEWLKSSYLGTAAEYITLDRKMSAVLFGRDIKYVLLLHIGGFDSMMLPALLDLLKKQGFDFVSLEDAAKDPAYQTDPDAPLKYGGTLLEQLIEGRHLKYPPHAEKPMEKLNSICR
jgi:peptidoglycan/xylan/chitin deacetylase (PgdA/CDA1 family)